MTSTAASGNAGRLADRPQCVKHSVRPLPMVPPGPDLYTGGDERAISLATGFLTGESTLKPPAAMLGNLCIDNRRLCGTLSWLKVDFTILVKNPPEPV